MRSLQTKVAVFLVCWALASAASADSWPVKPVHVINPFAAGGGTDAFGRPLAAKLSQILGQQFIIENQGGAGGTLGASNAAKAPADGYTLLLGAVHHTIAESLYSHLPYSLERDFVPITVVAYVPNVVVVYPGLDIHSIHELIDYAHEHPGKLTFGSGGNGTSHHLAAELFKTMAKVSLTHVPYRGAGPMMQDLLAGQIDLAFDGMGTSAAQIKAGKLRPLAVTTVQRSPLIPEVPTMQEAGVPGYAVTTWYGLWAVRGTPERVVEKLYAACARALKMPDIQQLWAQQGASPGGQPPAAFNAFVKQEIARWARVVQAANLRIDL